jgi:ribosomal protein L11 methyltransferase
VRRVRVALASGAGDLAELFKDLGGEVGREEGAVVGAFGDERPEGLEDRIEHFLHLIDRGDAARLSTARDGGPWLPGWQALFEGVDVGRFRVRPPWAEAPASGVVVVVDPRGAFGSGSHPTTQLALQLLDQCLDGRRRTLLDVGTGSGVLAVAAARAGLSACAVEIEPRARAACARTAGANGVVVEVLEAIPQRTFDLVMANLSAPALLSLADRLRQAVAPGGALVASGLLAHQATEVLDKLGAVRREIRSPCGEWVAAAFGCRGMAYPVQMGH